MESKFKAMTTQLQMLHSDEDVAAYIKWIIKSDITKNHYAKLFGDLLSKSEIIESAATEDYRNQKKWDDGFNRMKGFKSGVNWAKDIISKVPNNDPEQIL